MLASLTVPTSMEGVWSRRGHMGPRSGAIACTRDPTILQSYPHVRVNPSAICGAVEENAQELHTRYLASDIQADYTCMSWDTSREKL